MVLMSLPFRIGWITLTNVSGADLVPPDDGGPDESAALHPALTRVLRWASRETVVRELAGPAADDLSPTDLWLLDGVVRSGPVRIGDIASWQGVDKSTVTAQLHRLTDRGLLVRAADPSDGRAVLVSASASGRALHQTVSSQGARVLAGLLEHWDPADRRDLARLLTRFADELGGGPVRR
jgi:DNA-binding MarR family transcriptional regulator